MGARQQCLVICVRPCHHLGMTEHMPLLVFTDLDGTLIDHHSYDWSPAKPALDALNRIGAGVILASSKTAPEIHQLRADLGLVAWPAIVENGAGLLPAYSVPEGASGEYEQIRAILAELPTALRRHFTGFGDMSAAEVSRLTGLAQTGAALAQDRNYSEPGLWQGTAADKEDFLASLADHGVIAQQGGRFLTLSFGATKADQVRGLCLQYQPETTIALGDAPNDAKMLEACDFGVVIANPNRDPLPALKTESAGRILRTHSPGPIGWNAAIMTLLSRLNLT